MNLSDQEKRMIASLELLLFGSWLTYFAKYIDLYAEPIRQAIEAVIGVCVVGGYLLFLYGIGGVFWFGLKPEATFETYLEDFGGMLVIFSILILIFMNLPFILVSVRQVGLGI